MLFKHFIRLSGVLLGISFVPLYGMKQLIKKDSHYQTAPITTWPNSLYDNAYQGANYNLSHDKKRFIQTGILGATITKEKAAKERLDEQGRVIFDWFHALQKTEALLLKKPFETWTIDDIKQISAWLTRLDKNIELPGTFRTTQSNWQIKSQVDDQEWTYATCLAKKKIYAHDPEALAVARNQPDFLPSFLEPMTETEEAYLKTVIHFFPRKEALETELATALEKAKKALIEAKELAFEEKQQKAFSVGCVFHFDMVRIHPFKEGSKRLGRLCMFIIHAQHGIRPCAITQAERYIQALIEGLKIESHEPFEKFMRSCIEQDEPVKVAIPQRAPKVLSAKSTTVKPTSLALPCAQCNTKGTDFKRCGRCKSVVYCGAECQANHWKAGHKESCKPAAAHDLTAKK